MPTSEKLMRIGNILHEPDPDRPYNCPKCGAMGFDSGADNPRFLYCSRCTVKWYHPHYLRKKEVGS